MVRLSALLFATLAVATPVNRIIPRQANGTSITCGSTTYDEAAINEATEKGCELHEAGETLGNNNYPHKFNNREGLPLETDGPYQEFPILPSGEYDGGSPDTDRVVFNPDYEGECIFVGGITHTGADGNNFVSCEAN